MLHTLTFSVLWSNKFSALHRACSLILHSHVPARGNSRPARIKQCGINTRRALQATDVAELGVSIHLGDPAVPSPPNSQLNAC
eukprot:TsM_000422000 transcript=TsM_000422000 gene=TsM_000422000